MSWDNAVAALGWVGRIYRLFQAYQEVSQTFHQASEEKRELSTTEKITCIANVAFVASTVVEGVTKVREINAQNEKTKIEGGKHEDAIIKIAEDKITELANQSKTWQQVSKTANSTARLSSALSKEEKSNVTIGLQTTELILDTVLLDGQCNNRLSSEVRKTVENIQKGVAMLSTFHAS